MHSVPEILYIVPLTGDRLSLLNLVYLHFISSHPITWYNWFLYIWGFLFQELQYLPFQSVSGTLGTFA